MLKTLWLKQRTKDQYENNWIKLEAYKRKGEYYSEDEVIQLVNKSLIKNPEVDTKMKSSSKIKKLLE